MELLSTTELAAALDKLDAGAMTAAALEITIAALLRVSSEGSLSAALLELDFVLIEEVLANTLLETLEDDGDSAPGEPIDPLAPPQALRITINDEIKLILKHLANFI